MEYMSIIEIESGTVKLTNVNFYNIVPSSQGSVIMTDDKIDFPNEDASYFEYNGGKVQLLNNGFEMIQENKVGSFLDLYLIDEIKLNGLEFSYNLLNSKDSSLITLMDFYIATITDCQFFYNYSPGNLIYLNQENINLYQDSAENYVNEEGVYIASSKFYNNTANYLIYGYYKSSCQNILIENIEVNDNMGENILIYIKKEGSVDNTCYEGDASKGINKMHLIIQDSYFSGNAASKIIEISTIANLELSNLEFYGIGYFTDTNEVMFDIFTAYQDVYLTETDLVKETSCIRVIYLSSIKSLLISGITMDGNICSILELSSVSGEISITESIFSNIDLKNSQGPIKISSYSDLDITNLSFYNISCPACGNGIIILSSPDYSITANLENLIFESACYALTISSMKTIVLNNIKVFNCIAETYSGLSLTLMVNSKVFIQNSVFSNNTGICVYIDSSGSSISIELSIEDSIFEHMKDTSSVIEIANSVTLDSISKISNTKFINNLNELINLASIGKLTISDCYFGYNDNYGANLINVLGDIEFIVEDSIFEYNIAQAILLFEKFSFDTVSKTKNCIFRYNKSTGINVMQSYYEDEGSEFYSNSFLYCPAICLTGLAIGNITGTRITSNIAETKSIIYMTYSSILYMYDLYIAYNIVGSKGILFVDDSSKFYLENSEFVENTASQGSCIFIQHSYSSSFAYNTKFTKNSAKETGCICLLESTLALDGCTFDANTGTSRPAIDVIYYSNITIENSYFSYHVGEGAHISIEGSSIASIKSTVFTNGYSGSSESSIKIYGSDFTCEECTIKNSDFSQGNTVHCERS